MSLSDPTQPAVSHQAAGLLLNGPAGANKPYLSLSGTSMAAPVVAGTVALMLQANPSLTPNLVKAMLQYTAQVYPGYNALTQGAGFLNTKGAVDLARFFKTAQAGQRIRVGQVEPHLIWGSYRLQRRRHQAECERLEGGRRVGRAEGRDRPEHRVGHAAERVRRQHRVGHGALRRQHRVGHGSASEDNIVWGTSATATTSCGARSERDNIVWGTSPTSEDNIVLGHDCGGADCTTSSGARGPRRRQHRLGHGRSEDNIVWGTSGATDNIIWATSGEDNVALRDPSRDPVSYDTWRSMICSGSVSLPAPRLSTSLTGAHRRAALMEKMPFRDAQTVMDVNAVINAARSTETVDGRDQLAAVAAGADGNDGDAPRAAAFGRAFAAGDAVDRGSGAVHLAAPDDG